MRGTIDKSIQRLIGLDPFVTFSTRVFSERVTMRSRKMMMSKAMISTVVKLTTHKKAIVRDKILKV